MLLIALGLSVGSQLSCNHDNLLRFQLQLIAAAVLYALTAVPAYGLRCAHCCGLQVVVTVTVVGCADPQLQADKIICLHIQL